MSDDKNLHYREGADEGEAEGEAENAPRARNRTVMLTPEITGQVRARLAKEMDPSAALADLGGGSPEQSRSNGGFTSVTARRPPAEPSADPRGPRPSPSAHSPEPRRNEPARPAPRAEYAAPPSRSAPMPEPEGDLIEWKKSASLVGILVTYDRDSNGEIYPLRSGRLIVTSEMPSGGNFLFLADESVSSMHAIVRIGEDGAIQILDQLSENGTNIRRVSSGEEVNLSGDKANVEHGDEIAFGNRKFTVCILPRRAE